ncbi:hypothetical protein STEG23_009548 [Scotinomys teguina]
MGLEDVDLLRKYSTVTIDSTRKDLNGKRLCSETMTTGLFSYPKTGRDIELVKWTSCCEDTEKEAVLDAAEGTWPLKGPKA